MTSDAVAWAMAPQPVPADDPLWRMGEVPSIASGILVAAIFALMGIPVVMDVILGAGAAAAATLTAVGLGLLAGQTAMRPQDPDRPLGPATAEELDRRLSLLEDRVRALEASLRSLEIDHGVERHD